MTVSKHEVTAVVDVGAGIILDPIDARITLDDGWMPYIQAELTCWTPEEAELELLDPREQLRVTLTVTKEFGTWNAGQLVDQTRTFDLLLRSRTVDHTTGTMVLVAESDESLLEDLALVATSSERVYGVSVKTAVEYALDKIGAALEAGASDANLDPDPNLPAPLSNLIANPSVETNTTGWAASSANFTIARSTTYAYSGTHCAAWTMTAAAAAYGSVLGGGTLTAVPSTAYSFSFYVRSSVARSAFAQIRFMDAGSTMLAAPQGATVATTTTGWTRVTITAAAPANTTQMLPLVNITGSASGNVHYLDGVMLNVGPTLEDYFDGDTVDDDLFEYAWSGTAHASTSTKTAKPNTEAMVWQPGVSAWEYLEPLLQATGLRLYCNEAREWILEPSGTARPGQVNIAAGSNVTAASDQISRREEWYDAVLIAYTKALDAEGRQVTVYDAAGAPGTKALVLEYDRPYPGLGGAQAVLNRAQGRGRVLKLEAINDYTATPGMTLSASLPDSPIQTGTISSVEWSWPADRMTLGSRGLTDTPDTAWILAEELLAWEDIAVGIDWTEYTS